MQQILAIVTVCKAPLSSQYQPYSIMLLCQVEAAAKEVAKELAVGLEEGSRVVAPGASLAERLAARAEKSFEVSCVTSSGSCCA